MLPPQPKFYVFFFLHLYVSDLTRCLMRSTYFSVEFPFMHTTILCTIAYLQNHKQCLLDLLCHFMNTNKKHLLILFALKF